jgi:aminopeptidase N
MKLKYYITPVCLLIMLLLNSGPVLAQHTHADTLRGSYSPERDWWDVVHYDLQVRPDITAQTISGSVGIRFKVLKAYKRMQLDLQQPLQIDEVIYNKERMPLSRDGNAWFVEFPATMPLQSLQDILVLYHGTPRKAVNPPWDGGLIWRKDARKNPWVGVACQGLGASVWWPTKDHQSDEVDSALISITVPDTLTNISNGRLRAVKDAGNGMKTWVWAVTNPINNYNITLNIGKYAHWSDTLQGEKGKLDLDYYVIDYNLEKAKKQFEQVKPMMRCFEYWFGPYPFYEDGYKLVESFHLGMEHQSAVAYGNKYQNGYLGNDLSGTGWGRKWDFIIVHESGHEWFGNNITTKDIADMWVHEGMTNYSETLLTECWFGKDAGNEYNRGIRRAIGNNEPIIGTYNVNKEGSGDMYYKGGNLMHTIRQTINDDELFRSILRGLNKDYYHQTVTGKQVEEYISKKSRINFSKVFDQYLRDTRIPRLDIFTKKKGKKTELWFAWSNSVKGFDLPVKIQSAENKFTMIYPTEAYKSITLSFKKVPAFIKDIIDKNIYIEIAEVKKLQ